MEHRGVLTSQDFLNALRLGHKSCAAIQFRGMFPATVGVSFSAVHQGKRIERYEGAHVFSKAQRECDMGPLVH